jgi:hypothetical protein
MGAASRSPIGREDRLADREPQRRPGEVRGPHGEAVDERLVERRLVGVGGDGPGERQAERPFEVELDGLQGLRVLEDPCERLVHRQHGGTSTLGDRGGRLGPAGLTSRGFRGNCGGA